MLFYYISIKRMRRSIFIISALLSLIFTNCNNSDQKSKKLVLRYDTPAEAWEETLPLGNGRIGMMPDGGINSELIVLNDITMWSGSEDEKAQNQDAIKYLSKIQGLLLDGENIEAQELMYKHFNCGGLGSSHGNGKDAPYGCFQILANLNINYRYPNNSEEIESVSEYVRELSINDAVASTNFNFGGVNYVREYFASHKDDVLIIRAFADKKKSISFDLGLNRPERSSLSIQDNLMYLEGQLNDGHDGEKGVRSLTKLEIINTGGSIQSDDSTLYLLDADEAIIIISTSTNMLDKDFETSVRNLHSSAKDKSFKKLKSDHIKAYKQKFDRVTLDLGDQDNVTPTDQRLIDFQHNDHPSFAALYFQYGRYLMISGTNENSLPLNLQGLWSNQVQTPWNGDYHLNINVQMNYWPAEVSNLQELHKPLLQLTKSLVSSGEKTAQTFYGADGWVAHMMTNPWGFSAPGEHASWGATNTGGAWLCQHLWEHYAFTQDVEYLRSVYHVLKGASDFFLSSMIREPKNNWLVTAPSSSPENAFYLPGSKENVFVCMGPIMDVQLVRELFENTLAAAEILNIKDKTIEGIERAIIDLPPLQISANGYLQEWLEDYEEQDPQHRHVSHLYGLYPSNQISPISTPELAMAARETLNRRGDAGTGWSRAWKINFWARLHDGNRAYKLLKSLLEPSFDTEVRTGSGGGTYKNLFCAHPPFQIDGNFGGTSGIAEMLLQSHNGFIQFLPALPDNWSSGRFTGLRVRGGAEVDAEWESNNLTSIWIKAQTDNTFKIKVPDNATSLYKNKKELQIENGFVTLTMRKGDEVKLEINCK